MPVRPSPSDHPIHREPTALLWAAAFLVLSAIIGLAAAQPGGAALAQGVGTPTPTLAPGAGAIVGQAWQDLNGDGLQDPGEPPLAGLAVTLTTQGGQPVGTAVTGADGAYRFDGLASGLYRIAATPPPAYRMTTTTAFNVFIGAGNVLPLYFGAQFVPSPTPTPTPLPLLDISQAEFAVCGSILQGDTGRGQSRVDRYGCRPAWDESGPEWIYRIELGRSQPITAALLSASADLDLFLLPSVYPETCEAFGDTYLAFNAQPGVHFLVVDGYAGAQGTFELRLECPYAPQASPTPTRIPTRTPTATPTPTPAPTRTPTTTPRPNFVYLPLVLRIFPVPPPEPATLVLQQGADGYAGTTDTTLSAWEPGGNFGGDPRLRLRYNKADAGSTEMAPLLRFNLTLLPTQAIIVSAQVRLYLEAPPRYDLRAEAHDLLRPWNENAATWLQAAEGQPWTAAGAQAAGSDYGAAPADQAQIQLPDWYAFDVTSLAQRWVASPAANQGLILLARAGDSNSNVEAGFAGRDHTNAALRPQLSVTYYLNP